MCELSSPPVQVQLAKCRFLPAARGGAAASEQERVLGRSGQARYIVKANEKLERRTAGLGEGACVAVGETKACVDPTATLEGMRARKLAATR